MCIIENQNLKYIESMYPIERRKIIMSLLNEDVPQTRVIVPETLGGISVETNAAVILPCTTISP